MVFGQNELTAEHKTTGFASPAQGYEVPFMKRTLIRLIQLVNANVDECGCGITYENPKQV